MLATKPKPSGSVSEMTIGIVAVACRIEPVCQTVTKKSLLLSCFGEVVTHQHIEDAYLMALRNKLFPKRLVRPAKVAEVPKGVDDLMPLYTVD
jgi:hypothetical protein